MRNRIVLVVVAVAVLAATTGCPDGSGQKADTFTRDCTARGGHVGTERHGHGIRRVCLPPPGGWQ